MRMKPELAQKQAYDLSRCQFCRSQSLQSQNEAICLDQELANNGCGPNSTPDHVFINKVGLEHSHTQFFTYCLWLLLTTTADLSSPNKNHIAHKPKTFMI